MLRLDRKSDYNTGHECSPEIEKKKSNYFTAMADIQCASAFKTIGITAQASPLISNLVCLSSGADRFYFAVHRLYKITVRRLKVAGLLSSEPPPNPPFHPQLHYQTNSCTKLTQVCLHSIHKCPPNSHTLHFARPLRFFTVNFP